MNPIDVIWWALAALVVAFVAYLVFAIILAAARAVKRTNRAVDNAPVFRGERKP